MRFEGYGNFEQPSSHIPGLTDGVDSFEEVLNDAAITSPHNATDTDGYSLTPEDGSQPAYPKAFLDFRQRFDGSQPQLSESEKEIAATVFSTFVDGHLLDYGQHQPGGSVQSELHLSTEASIVYVLISEATDDITGKATKRIWIEQYDDGLPTESCGYKLDHRGVVRRFDSPAATDQDAAETLIALLDLEAPKPPEEMTNIEWQEHTGKIKDFLLKDAYAQIIDEQLGLANQPVDAAEIHQLIQIIRHSM